jgi:hypothetical protein
VIIPRWAPSVGLVLGIVVGLVYYGYTERRIGAAKAAESQAKKAARVAADSALLFRRQRDSLAGAIATRDSVFDVKQRATAGLAGRYRAQRNSLLGNYEITKSGNPPALLAPVLAACDSLAAAATDTMPCHGRIAARDSALQADSLERAQHLKQIAALNAANKALERQRPGFLGRIVSSTPFRVLEGIGLFFAGRASK